MCGADFISQHGSVRLSVRKVCMKFGLIRSAFGCSSGVVCNLGKFERVFPKI